MRLAVHDERGSVLVLGVGLIVTCALAVALLTDVSSALLQRHRVQALADGAALAAAQAIDLTEYYAEGASDSTRLDPSRVGRVARDHLSRASAGEEIDGLVVNRIWSDGSQVLVALSAPLDLPFLADLFPADVRVEAWAQLAYREYRDGS